MDAVGAFVNRGDAHIAHKLRRACFFDKAHAAENLHRQIGQGGAVFGAPAFYDGDQKVQSRLRLFLHIGARVAFGGVQCGSGL